MLCCSATSLRPVSCTSLVDMHLLRLQCEAGLCATGANGCMYELAGDVFITPHCCSGHGNRHESICPARCSLVVDIDVALGQHDVTGEGMLMLKCRLHQVDATLL